MNPFTNPLYQAARAARQQPKQLEQPEQPKPEEPQDQEQQSIPAAIGSNTLSGIGAVGNLLDLPGSMVRDVVSGNNPFDQVIDPFGRNAAENRVEGRDLLRKTGLVGERDTYGNFATGLALEAALDPLTYVGVGAASKAAKAMKAAGITSDLRRVTKEAAEMAGKTSAFTGAWGSKYKLKPKDIFKHLDSKIEDILQNRIDKKAAGKRFGKANKRGLWDSPEELKNINEANLKDGHWAAVDDGKQLSIYEWNEGKGWNVSDELTNAARAELRDTAVNMTPKQATEAYKRAYQAMYKADGMADLDKPLASVVSAAVPFGGPRADLFAKRNKADEAFDEWIQRQPGANFGNKGPGRGDDIDFDVGPQGGSPGGGSPDVPTPKAPSPVDETTKAGTYEEITTAGTEASRVLNEATAAFGTQAAAAMPVVEAFAKTWGKLNNADPDEYFKGLKISDEAGDAVETGKDGATIFQGAERTIVALEKPNVATFMHEVGHDARRMFPDAIQTKMDDAIVKRMEELKISSPLRGEDGKWTQQAEEVFADSFESYLKEGKSPVKGLEAVFSQLKEWMTDIYRNVTGTPALKERVNPELRSVLDEMLGKEAAAFKPGRFKKQINDIIEGGEYTQAKLLGDIASGEIPVSPKGAATKETVEAIQKKVASTADDIPPAVTNGAAEAATKATDDIAEEAVAKTADDVAKEATEATGEIAEEVPAKAKEPLDVETQDALVSLGYKPSEIAGMSPKVAKEIMAEADEAAGLLDEAPRAIDEADVTMGGIPEKADIEEVTSVADEAPVAEATPAPTGSQTETGKITDTSQLPAPIQSAIEQKILPALYEAEGSAGGATRASQIIGEALGGQMKDVKTADKLHQFLLKNDERYQQAYKAMNGVDEVVADAADDVTQKNYVATKEVEEATEADFAAKVEPGNFTKETEQYAFNRLNFLKKQIAESANAEPSIAQKARGLREELVATRNQIIENYQPLIRKIAGKYGKNFTEKAELEQIGNMEAIKLVERHDPSKGSFYSLLNQRLRGAALDSKKSNALSKITQAVEDTGVIPAKETKRDLAKVAQLQEQVKNLLPEDEYKLFNDVYIEKKTRKQIAEELGVTDTTVANRMSRIASKVQEELKFQDAPVEVLYKTTPAEKAANISATQLNETTWKELFQHMQDGQGKRDLAAALDIGENLFYSNPAVRRFYSLFDYRVMGATKYTDQELMRKRFTAYERAIHSFREVLNPMMRILGETRVLDESSEFKRVAKEGLKGDEAKKAVRDRLNARHRDVIRFMEGVEDKLPAGVFGDENTTRKIEGALNAIKQLFPERLRQEAMAGLKGFKLMDDEIEYFPRLAHSPNKPAIKGQRGTTAGDTSQTTQRKRKLALKNLPGGRAVIDEMSIDPQISGRYWDETLKGNVVGDELMEELRETILSNDKYRDGILSDGMLVDGELTKEGQKRVDQVASAMAMLDPGHAAEGLPLYGNNFLRDVGAYIEQSFAKEGVARLMQNLAADNITTGDEFTLRMLLKNTKMDRHQAFKNVIDKAGRSADYQEFQMRRVAEIRDKLDEGDTLNLSSGGTLHKTDDGKYIISRKGDVEILRDGEPTKELLETIESKESLSDDEFARIFNLGGEFADETEMSVSKETFESASFYMKPWSSPQEISDLKAFSSSMLNLFRSHVTVPHPAFWGRNVLSGAAQNWFYGAFDPTSKSGRFGGILKPTVQAFTLSRGESVKNLYSEMPKNFQDEIAKLGLVLNKSEDIQKALGEVPQEELIETWKKKASQEMKDEAATEWVRDRAFTNGITGDRQGYAAEQIGEAVSSYPSQRPGTMAAPKSERGIRNLWGALPEREPVDSFRDYFNPLKVRGGGRPYITNDGARPGVAWKTYESSGFAPSRVGEGMSELGENVNRVAPFLSFLKQGFSPEQAAAQVNRIQVDYSTLSEAEKKIRGLVPFYTFSSRVMPLTLGDIITNPAGKQAWAIRATTRAQGDQTQQPVPDHVTEGAAVPLGQREDGTRRYITGLGLAFEDPLGFFDGMSVSGAVKEGLSRFRPGVQGAMEIASGRSLFFGRDLNDLDPSMGRLRQNVTDLVSGGERSKGLAEPVISQGAEFLVGKSPAARYLSSMNKALDGRKTLGERAMNLLTGVKLTDVNPEAADRVQLDRATEALQELGGRESSYTYIPDWQKKRMDLSEQQQADAIMAFISETRKKMSDRKKQAESIKNAVE